MQSWTDSQINKIVIHFAKICGWSPREGNGNNAENAIGFLERKFGVNYDQRHLGDVENLFDMAPKNHHMKSLAHSPDIVGLFFSVLNQFTSTSSFLHNGQLITVQTKTFELQGHNFIAKLFCGIVNWFGHIMSDVAGSSGATNRGSGIVIPFYELFQLCNWGDFQADRGKTTLSNIAIKVFQDGYDARFGLTMAIPALLCDLSIKLIWAIKHYFYHKRPFTECIPSSKHDDLRVMLLLGNGALCLLDGVDAAIRSGGNLVNFLLRLNIIAWFRLVMLILREVCIRLGIGSSLQKQLDAYIRINEALTSYLSQLEQIDIERFKQETEQYNKMILILENSDNEKHLNKLLKEEYRAMGLKLPYDGSFDNFMQDDSLVLEFK